MESSPASKTPHTPPAPAFTANGYPFGGERIGPAWVTAWTLLHTKTEIDTETLVNAMLEHKITQSTARNLLGMAAKAGHICGVKYGGPFGKKVLSWRLATDADRVKQELPTKEQVISEIIVRGFTSGRGSATDLVDHLISLGWLTVTPSQASTERADMATDHTGTQAG
jgi:hypothetical protein